jgi:hypothetical protein
MQNLINDGKSPEIAGMIWMQGETDAQNIATANAYEVNLKNLITHVRSDFDSPNMRFVLGRITTFYDSKPAGGNATVRSSQVSVGCDFPNTAWIDTDDLQWAYDAHYGTQGQIELGIRFANAMVAPEPSSWVLVGSGLFMAAGYLCRKRRLSRRNAIGTDD